MYSFKCSTFSKHFSVKNVLLYTLFYFGLTVLPTLFELDKAKPGTVLSKHSK